MKTAEIPHGPVIPGYSRSFSKVEKPTDSFRHDTDRMMVAVFRNDAGQQGFVFREGRKITVAPFPTIGNDRGNALFFRFDGNGFVRLPAIGRRNDQKGIDFRDIAGLEFPFLQRHAESVDRFPEFFGNIR